MILVCGEALIDLLIQSGPAGLSVEAVVGGSPFNVAVGLARLGRPVAFLGGISRDGLGEELAGRLSREGIDPRFLRRTDARTTVAIATAVRTGHIDYRFCGEDGADRAVRVADLPPAGTDFTAIIAGSYSLAVEPIGSAIEALIAREGARTVVSLDPNLRRDIVGDLDRWRARFDRLLAHAAIIKASDEDLAAAFTAEDPTGLADRWLAAGARLVVITRSQKGSVAYSLAGAVEVPAAPVTFVDAVGAGDSFHAGLLAFLDERRLLNRESLTSLNPATLHEALAFAAAAAALTCSRRGADLPTTAEIAIFSGASRL